jgi:CheY-like chemotaxis protein
LYNIAMPDRPALTHKFAHEPGGLPAPVQRQPRSTLRGIGMPQRVLLVEDDFMLRAHLAELLMWEGYQVSCAADGDEAFTRLVREPLPFAIILDIVLPRVNGVSFRQRQMVVPELNAIPTIAMTGIKNLDDLQHLAFNRVLSKPASIDRLVEALAQLGPTA